MYMPSYISLHKSGKLKMLAESLWQHMEKCDVCPRNCGANRLIGEKGTCGADASLRIASFGPHFGEERELVGKGGSGTLFMSYCSLQCVFCLNYDISHGGVGQNKTTKDFADMMLQLQEVGCSNINIVTPSHYLPHLLHALDIAAGKGLKLPLVYNTSGWEKLSIIKKLNQVVDIYLTDFKYYSKEKAMRYSPGAASYPEITKRAIIEFHKQVGNAVADADGIIRRGLMIRHLIMPNNLDETENILQWIGQNLPKDTYVNVMTQYRPMYKAFEYPEISRRITIAEYKRAEEAAIRAGLTNYKMQR